MSDSDSGSAIRAEQVAPRTRTSNYPEPFASRMAGRDKRQLGAHFGLANFGVNLTYLDPPDCHPTSRLGVYPGITHESGR